MRLYGKKNVRRLVDKRTKKTQEMRDAVLWEVDGEVCRVKIQGSDNLVVAHFPKNQKENPSWLSPGNAVKIVHKDGVRGYVELIGSGRNIPTPIAGASFPEVGDISDGIMSGLVVTIHDETCFKISAGVYRYNGILYSVSGTSYNPYVMDVPPPLTMGDDPIYMGDTYMGEGRDVVCISAVPASGYARYDVIYIDKATGTFGIVGGLHALIIHLGCEGPVIPSTPDGAIRLAFVLIIGNGKNLEKKNIDRVWTDPYYVRFTWVWGEGYVGEVDNPWKPGDPPSVMYDAIIIDKFYSQYDLPLWGKVEMAIGISYGDLWPPELQDYILFDFITGTILYHPASHFVVWRILITMIEDEPMKFLIRDIRHGDWIPENDPIYSIIINMSVRKKSRVLNETGIMLEEGSMVGNYTELMYWIGRDPYTDDVLPFGGDMEDAVRLWE